MKNARTIITLPEEDKDWIERYSRRKGVSMAEAIRKGIAILRKEESSSSYNTALESTRGIWTKGDGLQYQEKVRKEWR
jgi:hypothetical protein